MTRIKVGNEAHAQNEKAYKVIYNTRFWERVGKALKMLEPLIKVHQLVDEDDKPTMSFLYEAILRVKLAIETTYKYHNLYYKIISE